MFWYIIQPKQGLRRSECTIVQAYQHIPVLIITLLDLPRARLKVISAHIQHMHLCLDTCSNHTCNLPQKFQSCKQLCVLWNAKSQTSSSPPPPPPPPVIFIAGRPKAALLFFGSLVILDVARCYLWLFTLYINIKIGKNSC